MSESPVEYSHEALSAVVRRHRKRVGFSQEELGRRAQYQSGAGVAVSRIESGQTAVGPARMAQLAEALDVTADRLISEACAATKVGSNPEGGAATTTATSERETLRERRARVERRVEQRQMVLDHLKP